MALLQAKSEEKERRACPTIDDMEDYEVRPVGLTTKKTTGAPESERSSPLSTRFWTTRAAIEKDADTKRRLFANEDSGRRQIPRAARFAC